MERFPALRRARSRKEKSFAIFRRCLKFPRAYLVGDATVDVTDRWRARQVAPLAAAARNNVAVSQHSGRSRRSATSDDQLYASRCVCFARASEVIHDSARIVACHRVHGSAVSSRCARDTRVSAASSALGDRRGRSRGGRTNRPLRCISTGSGA